jgi:hypothetical protein
MGPRFHALALVALLALVAPRGGAELPSEVPLADVLDVLVLDRDLLAVDAASGAQVQEPLRLGEQVLWTGSRGRIGVALTDQRILAVTVGSSAWQETDLHREEPAPDRAWLGERVALVATPRRVLGFDGHTGNLVEARLGVRERLLHVGVGETVGVAVTDRRALGVSSGAGGFFPVKIDLEERLESVTASANLATVTTQRRLLVFRGSTGSWEERRRTLR